MDVKDALDLVHRAFVRRDEKRREAARKKQDRDAAGECGANPHCVVTFLIERAALGCLIITPPAENRSTATTRSGTRYQIPRGMRAMCGRARAVRQTEKPSPRPPRSAAARGSAAAAAAAAAPACARAPKLPRRPCR